MTLIDGVMSKHTGGSISTAQHRYKLQKLWGRPPLHSRSSRGPIVEIGSPFLRVHLLILLTTLLRRWLELLRHMTNSCTRSMVRIPTPIHVMIQSYGKEVLEVGRKVASSALGRLRIPLLL